MVQVSFGVDKGEWTDSNLFFPQLCVIVASVMDAVDGAEQMTDGCA